MELHRIYNDLIMCYKTVFGIVGMEIGDFFTFNTRGHPYKLYVHHNCLTLSPRKVEEPASPTVTNSCKAEILAWRMKYWHFKILKKNCKNNVCLEAPGLGTPCSGSSGVRGLNVRTQLFACPVVNVWNSLPAECTNFSSLTNFRLSLLNVDFSKF